MQKTILSKIIAVVLLLVFILPVFGTTAYAVAEEVVAIQENLRTSTRFVDASLAFMRGEETLDYIVADVNDKSLKLRIFLNIKDEGYFQGGQIEIRNPENLTYEFVEPEEKSDLIQSVENYMVKLNQVKGMSETYLEIPIKYNGIDNVDSKLLLNKNEIELTGEYVNAQGRRYDVFKRVALSLNWIDKKEIEINNQVQKFIKHETTSGKEIILQNLIVVKNKNSEISLPTQKMDIDINLLKLEDKYPKTVNVAIQKAELFNNEGKILLGKELYTWNKDKNLLQIQLENVKNEDETYSSGNGDLEILVTSFYEIENDFTKYEGDMNTLVKQFVLTGSEKLIEIQKSLQTNLKLDKEIGEMIDVSELTEINKLAKGILYVNSIASEMKANLVKSRMKLDISNIDIMDSIHIVENEPQYNNKSSEKNLIYKTIEINKTEFDTVFGEGYVDIYSDGKLLGRIDNKTIQVNNKYVFEFKVPTSKINIETSKPIKEGEVFIEITRNLEKSSQSMNAIRELKSLNINKKAYVVFNNKHTLLNDISHTIDLVDASSNVIVTTNKMELSTIKTNENVEFIIALNNDNLVSDVYGQTVLEIVLPQGIKDLKVKDTNLIHGNELKIASAKTVKQGTQHLLQIVLTGNQDGLSSGHLMNGTNIIINTDITLDQWTTSKDVSYQLRYSNVLATNYKNKVQWGMSSTFVNFEKFGNGLVEGKLKYVAPQGLVLINEFEKYNKKNDSVISINQGYKEGKLDVLSGKRIINASIYLLNNRGTEVTSPTVLGRIPSKENKNMFTNESLGSTFDMKLIKGIESVDGNVKIYYSSNPNATNDLKNVNNAWTETLNLNEAKSYLIVLSDKLANTKLMRFNYALEIPANLEHNQTIQTYSLVEYGANTSNGNIRYYQMASPIGLSTGEGVQLNIDIKANKEKITEAEDIVYSLEIKNEAVKTEAKNVESYFKIPENLNFKGIRDDGTQTKLKLSNDKKGVYLTLGDIAVGDSITKDLVFTAKEVAIDQNIELAVNVAAENFEIVKSKKALASTIEREKLMVFIEDLDEGLEKLNIYPKTIKNYGVSVMNTTGFSYNEKDEIVTYSEIFGKVNLSLQLPNTMEYVAEGSSLYRVTEYNRVTNLLKIELIADQMEAGEKVQFNLSLKLKDTLPASYNKTVNLSLNATTKIGNTNVSSTSNVITNYIAERKLNSSVEIYDVENYNKKPLKEVQEYQDIFIKYSLKPTYSISSGNFMFVAPAGVKVKAIYKYTTDKNNVAALTTGYDATGNHTYTYPFYIQANKKTDLYVQAYIEGIGEASLKTLTCKIGMEGSLHTISFNVKKGAIQNIVKGMYDKGKINLSPADKKKYGIGTGGASTGNNSVLGTTWIDNSQTGVYASTNQPASKVVVELVDNDTKKVVAKTMSDENGKYQFDNIVNGNYSAVFKYNDNKYVPTAFNVQGELEDNSKGVKVNLESQGTKNIAVTDGIQVNFASVKNIDLGLVEKSNFDLKLNGEISEIIVQKSDQSSETYNFKDRQTIKIELDRKNLDNTKVFVKYNIKAINEGELEGNVLKLNAYIPEGMKLAENLNPLWETDKEGNVFTTSLSARNLNPGDVEEINLILVKDFSNENLGLSTLGIEIAEAKNSLGLVDRDSTPNNKNLEEDDYIGLELILGLNTGKKVAYALLMLTVISAIGTMVFLVLRKINGKEIK